MLLVCLTKDGRWLQFASVAPHLFAACMKALGLDWMFTDPEWEGLPVFGDDAAKRMELWTRMLQAAREEVARRMERDLRRRLERVRRAVPQRTGGARTSAADPRRLHDRPRRRRAWNGAPAGGDREGGAHAGRPDAQRTRLDEHRADVLAPDRCAEAASAGARRPGPVCRSTASPCSSWRRCSPPRTARRCSPISAPGSSRSSRSRATGSGRSSRSPNRVEPR